jgi:hypothetical protein
MKNNSNITVIIPVHEVSDPNFINYLDQALGSIENNTVKPEELIIIRCGCGDVKDVLNGFNFGKYSYPIRVVENTSTKDFPTQINQAAKEVKTKFFSILEFDDEFSKTWIDNAVQHISAYPEFKLFLPIIADYTFNNKKEVVYAGYSNEVLWASEFSKQMGVMDMECLLDYPNFSIDGMVVDKEAFLESGGLKKNLKLTFSYEFLLRFVNDAYNSCMVIPKIGYKHLNMREGSLFWLYKNSDDPSIALAYKEAEFWIKTAKKEYYYKEDRKIHFVETLEHAED